MYDRNTGQGAGTEGAQGRDRRKPASAQGAQGQAQGRTSADIKAHADPACRKAADTRRVPRRVAVITSSSHKPPQAGPHARRAESTERAPQRDYKESAVANRRQDRHAANRGRKAPRRLCCRACRSIRPTFVERVPTTECGQAPPPAAIPLHYSDRTCAQVGPRSLQQAWRYIKLRTECLRGTPANGTRAQAEAKCGEPNCGL